MSANIAQRTFIAVKPDRVQRGLVGEIIKRFEERGYQLVALKMVPAESKFLEEICKDLGQKPLYAGLVKYMNPGSVVAMVWQGLQAVSTGRKLLGAANPLDSAPGTIRGDFCIQTGRNICHVSHSVESAEREIALWFQKEEVVKWELASKGWIYE